MIRNEVDTLRQQGIKWIAAAGWGTTFAIGLLTLSMGQQALHACMVSALLNIVPSLHALQRRSDLAARLAVALMAALQPALLL